MLQDKLLLLTGRALAVSIQESQDLPFGLLGAQKPSVHQAQSSLAPQHSRCNAQLAHVIVKWLLEKI